MQRYAYTHAETRNTQRWSIGGSVRGWNYYSTAGTVSRRGRYILTWQYATRFPGVLRVGDRSGHERVHVHVYTREPPRSAWALTRREGTPAPEARALSGTRNLRCTTANRIAESWPPPDQDQREGWEKHGLCEISSEIPDSDEDWAKWHFHGWSFGKISRFCSWAIT